MVVLDLRDGVDPLKDLTAQMIAEAGRADADLRYGIYYMGSTNRYSALGRFVEREVFGQRFGNDDQLMDEEYGPFETASDFMVCVDHHECEPAGVMRLIRPSAIGLKTMIDVAAEPRWGSTESDFLEHHHPEGGMDGVHDVATFAVRSQWSGAAGAATSHALYTGLFRWSLAVEAELLVSSVDEVVAGLMRALKIPMAPLCGLPAIEYLGSEATRPYVISVTTARREIRTDPELRELLVGQSVLDAYSFPPIDLSNAHDLVSELAEPDQLSPVAGR